MDFIEETLGEKVVRSPWQDSGKLPFFLLEQYTFERADIGTQNCLLIKPQGELGTVGAIKKHIGRIQNEWHGAVALELTTLSRQRKQTLVAEKIPFVVVGKQVYLPFMGVLLQEKYDAEKAPAADKLQPSAQMLLFCFILGKNAPLYLSQMPDKFGFSAMTVSRAANQLTVAGLLEVHKEGVQKVLTSALSPKELYEKAAPLLINPVRKRVYINKSELQSGFFTAGMSALAELSMLNHPEPAVYGTAKSVKPGDIQINLVDSDRQCEVELWRYDPTVISGESRADALSLACSLTDAKDERVEIAVEEILKKVGG